MNQPQSIIHKLPGHEIPRKLLETTTVKCPTVSGIAIREPGELFVERDTKVPNIEDLMKINVEAKDHHVVLFMGNVPGKHTVDDVQPFTVTIFADENDKVGKDILSVFVEGDFPKYSKPDSGHTDEYNFYHEYIVAKLEELYEDSDGDMGKFIAKLHKPTFEKDLLNYVGHRGVFLFLPLEGDPIKFGTNELGKGYDWGTVSQHLNWDKPEEVKPITTAVADTVKSVRKSIFGNKSADVPKPVPVKEEPQVDNNGVYHLPEKPKNDPIENTATAINVGKKLVKPPKTLEGSARNAWFRAMNGGNLPDNHNNKETGVWVSPELIPFAEREIHTKANVEALIKEMKGLKPKVETPKEVKVETKTEDKKPKPVDFLPTLDDKELTDFTGTLAKFIDREKAPSPLEIQKMEAPWKTFSETGGIPFTDTLRYTIHDLMQFDKKALGLLILETRRKYIESSNIKLEDLVATAPVKEVGGPQTKTVTEQPPKRKSIFGRAA